jgi:hypothetical protein
MNITNNYLFKYITLYNSILFKNQGGDDSNKGDWFFH